MAMPDRLRGTGASGDFEAGWPAGSMVAAEAVSPAESCGVALPDESKCAPAFVVIGNRDRYG